MKINFLQSLTNTNAKNLVVLCGNHEDNISSIIKEISEDILVEHNFHEKSVTTLLLKSFGSFTNILIIKNDDKENTVNYLSLGGKIASTFKKSENIAITSTYELSAECTSNLLKGIQLKSWHFDKFITEEDSKKSYKINNVDVIGKEVSTEEINAVCEGVTFAKKLVSLPANELYPETFLNNLKWLEKHNVKITILDTQDMVKHKMGAFLSVSAGCKEKPPYIAILEYQGGEKSEAPVALVGKGVTYDTGGYSLKPAAAMIGMKKDMGGAAAVVGTIATVALRKSKTNVVGVVGLTENTINSNATKPGDIVTAANGKTIEILNTDAEGRMVLADVLWYTEKTFKPKAMINLATLTGAIIVSLGVETAGLFSNNQDLSNKLIESGEKTAEPLWQMPMSKAYKKYLKSSIADLQNISRQTNPGSTFAGLFLQEFVSEETPWAHLDIAGTADTSTELDFCQKGARGFGVMLLDNLIKTHYE